MKEHPEFLKSGSIHNKMYGETVTLTELNRNSPRRVNIRLEKAFAFDLTSVHGSWKPFPEPKLSPLIRVQSQLSGRQWSGPSQQGTDNFKDWFVAMSTILTPSQPGGNELLTPSLHFPSFFEGFETISYDLLYPEDPAATGDMEVSLFFKGVSIYTGVNQ